MLLQTLTDQLASANPLASAQIREAVAALLEPATSAEIKADFLSALAQKGETADEIAAFAMALRVHSLSVNLPVSDLGPSLLDVVGTGGDGAGTFNISTCVAILCAAAGVPVAKHGNRAATSRCGSADVLEELGIPINLDVAQAADQFKKHGFVFLFAPNFHPAFAHAAAARKLCAQRGIRTIFNLLGPLLNPAHPQAALAGVSRPDLCEIMTTAMKATGVRRAMTVCGEAQGGEPPDQSIRYLDEISTSGRTSICEFYQVSGFNRSEMEPEQFGFPRVRLDQLAGNNRKENAAIINDILAGRETGPKRDAVVFNAGAALCVAGAASSIQAGITTALDTIRSGMARAKLSALQGA